MEIELMKSYSMVSRSPFISFIIPVYKVEDYLRECLDSILSQDFSNYEIVLVNDGSPDNSPFICDEYAKKYSQIIVIHKKNGGVSSARNMGLDIAKGEWIWFIDADDFIKDKSLVHLVPTILSCDCDTVFHGLIQVYEDGTQIEELHIADLVSDKNTFLAHNYCFQNGMMLFKADIISQNNLRFVEGIKMGEDLEFQYRYLMMCKKPVRIEGNYYYYRHRDGSAICNPNAYKNSMKNNVANATSLFHFIKDRNIHPQLWIEKRIQLMLKASIQSSLRVDRSNRGNLQQELRVLVSSFKGCGFARVEDFTLQLACINLDVYLLFLNLFFKIKGVKY